MATEDQPFLAYSTGSVAKPLEPLRKRFKRWTICTLLALVLILAAWIALFSTPGLRTDPRSPRYLLWKHGLLPIQPQTAYIAMGLDIHRDSLVMGLTAMQLQKKFGRIRRPGNLLQYQQPYLRVLPLGTDCAWLGDSHYVVEFRNGRVVALHHFKG